jgi:hypothetical protein
MPTNQQWWVAVEKEAVEVEDLPAPHAELMQPKKLLEVVGSSGSLAEMLQNSPKVQD